MASMADTPRSTLRIDNSLLQELGLEAMPQQDKSSLLKHIYETLEMRVGMRLADQMTNEQLDEFERFFNTQDDAGAFHWLETNFPNYKEIVAEEFAKLKEEVAKTAPEILAAVRTIQQEPDQLIQ
jgi:predicted HicB family RNase H-like nuclease